MSERPALTLGLKRQDFLEYYYLKEELVKFCHDNGLPASGGKQELTDQKKEHGSARVQQSCRESVSAPMQ